MKRSILRILVLLCALALGAAQAEDAVDLLAVDHRLYELGYRNSDYRGILDESMSMALENFQRANGLAVSGEADAGTVFVLQSEGALSRQDYLKGLAQSCADADVMELGATGDSVRQLQQALADLAYFDGTVDGSFGESTAEAVRRFRFANGLEASATADGSVLLRLYGESPLRWDSFLASCTAAQGDSGARVQMLQYWLQKKGYFVGDCTGNYGDATLQAVRLFQEDVGLEPSGEANPETCRALYGSIGSLLADASTLRRGVAGADELCHRLSELGYPAHGSFDAQTELALMQFQWANALPVTGVADGATMDRLRAGDAIGNDAYRHAAVTDVQSEDLRERLATAAMHLLGQVSNFDEDFCLIQYTYLQCGVPIQERSQFTLVGSDFKDAMPGDVIVLELNRGERCGISAADLLVYCAGDGRVVATDPASIGASSVRLYRLMA